MPNMFNRDHQRKVKLFAAALGILVIISMLLAYFSLVF
jgi:hypothetical protein